MNISEISNAILTDQQTGAIPAVQIAADLSTIINAQVYARSITRGDDQAFFLLRNEHGKLLGILGGTVPDRVANSVVVQQVVPGKPDVYLRVMPLTAQNAQYMRDRIAWLRPAVLGLRRSVGCGDRLGMATPGHVRAVRSCMQAMAPIFAQQSIREMTRSQRTPLEVIDDAMWGVFQEGWRSGYGADADHLKTFDDIDRCVAAGFTFYTFDPGAYVDNEVDPARYEQLPWMDLESTPADTLARYKERFETGIIARAFVKYGRAIAQVKKLYRYLQDAMKGRSFEVEVSVDETEQPTTYAEHFVIAGELRRLDVEWVSLAPRFVGRFEKGVDYIGDLHAFEMDCADHVKVAQYWGPYKLSIHSGSDKYSIYPIVSRLAGDYVHLKTAGTSYLEALRTIARRDIGLFRDIYRTALEHYGEDRTSYHVSAVPLRAPDANLTGISDPQSVLDQFDARQMLHVCFGTILAAYGGAIKAVLSQNEEMHYADLQRHFERHLESFCN